MLSDQTIHPDDTPLVLLPSASPSRRAVPPESPKARAAYADYEDMGRDRSMAKLAAKYGKPPSYVRQLERWSEDYQWQARLKDHASAELQERRRKRAEALDEMDDRHATYGRAALLQAIQFLQEQFATSPHTTVGHAISLLRAAAELERLARGAATARIEGDVALTVLPKEYWGIHPDEEGSEP